MKIRHAQFALLAMFVMGLLLHLGCFAFTFHAGAIYMDDLQTLVVRILAIYSVPLGVIVGGIFAVSVDPAATARASTFSTAIALSLLWNLLLVTRSLLFAFADQDSIGSLLTYIDAVADASTFLIGAALAYFFVKSVTDASSG